MVDRWSERYSEAPGARQAVKDTVHEWFEQALVETVLGVQALSGSQEWSVEDIRRASSEEALTAAVMQRYHIDNSIKRVLGARLGSLKESLPRHLHDSKHYVPNHELRRRTIWTTDNPLPNPRST
jgi:hypothetical protein